jgi:predicted CopG family antitoxin
VIWMGQPARWTLPCLIMRIPYVGGMCRTSLAPAVSPQYTYKTRILWGLSVRKKLTITVDQQVYEGLHQVVGRHRISRFIEDLVRPHVVSADLDAAYEAMAQDEAREAEAMEWSETTIRDMGDETR